MTMNAAPAPSPPPLPAGSPCLQAERVAFTGILASMTHRQAHQLVEQHGGAATEHVSRQTTMLVVGEEGWPLEDDGRSSAKLLQVAEWQRAGAEIRVLQESEWLHLLGLEERRREAHRQCTPAMLSRMLDIPVSVIRRWERLGLIKPVRKVCRLPYFDFQEVAGTRKLSELLRAGVSQEEIERSLSRLQSLVPGLERPLSQLEILARDARVVIRDPVGLIEPGTRQRLFDFEPPPNGNVNSPDSHKSLELPSETAHREDGSRAQSNAPASSESVDAAVGESNERRERAVPGAGEHLAASIPFSDFEQQQRWAFEDWFDQGCRQLASGDVEAAVEAFRLCLMDKPADPEVNFYLAEALYRLGRAEAALERYHCAVESDHNYIEAWTQLGCLYEECGDFARALEAFQISLSLHPEYPDALFHQAEILYRLDRNDEARPLWQKYLEYDHRGPWAETARQRLESAADAVHSEAR